MYKKLMSVPTLETKVVASFSIFYIVVGLIVYAYVISSLKGKLGGFFTEKTFTVSDAIAFSDKIGLFLSLIYGFILLCYLIYLRGPMHMLNSKIILLTILVILVISIFIVTPQNNKEAHYYIAGVIFTLVVLFLFIIIYNLNYYFKKNKIKTNILYVLIAIIILNFIIIVSLGASFREGTVLEDIFAIFENTYIILLIFIIIMLGFY